MFLKSLLISTPTKVIREIKFHKGLNLIVDDTPSNGDTTTGNNVGKTTILKLIDFCFGKEGNVVYTDPENKKQEYKLVKDFLIKERVQIALTLVDDLDEENKRIEITRNFINRRGESICKVNDIDVAKSDLEQILQHEIFPTINVSKPTFRQIIAHNIRYEDIRLNNTLEILNPYTKLEEYETLYLFLFGCAYEEGQHKEFLMAQIKNELSYLKRLQREHTKNEYWVALSDVEREIEKLEDKKSKLNINQQLDEDLNQLTRIKEDLNAIGTKRNNLLIRKNIILESIVNFESQKFDTDLSQLRIIYQQAKALIPNLQHTFEEMVSYHNKMLENKVIFIKSDLPNIESQIAELNEDFNELRKQEYILTDKITNSDTFEELEEIINKLNDQYTRKGEYSKTISQIEDEELELKRYQEELNKIDSELFTSDYQNIVRTQINKFNAIFSDISEYLYNERYAVTQDIKSTRHNQNVYRFSIMTTNLSSGKKQGEISCFDIAYTIFADKENIPCLHFILNDKKELMHDNQLLKLAEVVNRENMQFVASILKDKLPTQLQKDDYYIIELSETDKLFRIENQ